VRQASIVVVTALLAGGCNSILGIDELSLRDAGGPPDQAADAQGAFCYGAFVKACFDQEPTAPVMLSGTLHTTTDPRCVTIPQTNGDPICAIAGTTITVTATTTVEGSRPLMLIATDTITVSNKLDVASAILGTHLGPGANSSLCGPTVNGSPGTLNGGAGGAPGGSFATPGGGGGAGHSTAGGAGAAAPANPAQAATVLRGGCPGGTGGSSALGGTGGAGGAGGGAVYLYAKQAIMIGAELRASGAAGRRGMMTSGGGGGGGSGGMVVLEAPAISVPGTINVNGGGGGEGARAGNGNDGRDDRDWDEAPTGGAGASSDGGDGGDGAFRTTAAEPGNNAGGGSGGGAAGGGGGGGAGALRYRGALSGQQLSTTPTTF
jgi:hypothetical protein